MNLDDAPAYRALADRRRHAPVTALRNHYRVDVYQHSLGEACTPFAGRQRIVLSLMQPDSLQFAIFRHRQCQRGYCLMYCRTARARYSVRVEADELRQTGL